jgi:hypothetical protein
MWAIVEKGAPIIIRAEKSQTLWGTFSDSWHQIKLVGGRHLYCIIK